MQKHHDDDNDFDVETEMDSGDDEVDFGHEAQAKIQELRKKLKTCEQERTEHLAGWQRAKADLVNYKREVADGYERERVRATENIITDLLAVVDSFGMAMRGQAWQNVDHNWRKGVEYIYAQLMNVLKDHDLEVFGNAGDVFDPNIHESVSTKEVGEKKADHTVYEIVQQGFRLHGHVIRPAKVVVAVYNAHTH